MEAMHKDSPDFEYNAIADGIFIGTNQCCRTHFDEALTRDGITADISLEENRLDAPFGVDQYLWLPVKNHTAPSPDQLEIGVSMLEKLVAMGKKVYVHCQNGHGRAPTLVAAYLIRKERTAEEAIRLIKSKRPTIHLQDVQVEALRRFSEKK